MTRIEPDLDALLADLGVPEEPLLTPPPRPRSWLLEHLSGQSPFAGFAGRFARIFQVSEGEAARLLAELGRATEWETFLPVADLRHFTPGPAFREPGMDAGFVRFASSSTFPTHNHAGDEHTLVLQGGFTDQLTGRHLLPGDTLTLKAGSSHTFQIDPEEPCIAAVLLLGPIAFTR